MAKSLTIYPLTGYRELNIQSGSTINSIKIIADHTTGMSKGFAFIEMPIEKEATTAIAELNNRDYNNRKISVQEARPKVKIQPGNNKYP